MLVAIAYGETKTKNNMSIEYYSLVQIFDDNGDTVFSQMNTNYTKEELEQEIAEMKEKPFFEFAEYFVHNDMYDGIYDKRACFTCVR